MLKKSTGEGSDLLQQLIFDLSQQKRTGRVGLPAGRKKLLSFMVSSIHGPIAAYFTSEFEKNWVEG